MSDPSPADAPPNICRCGRPRCTGAELSRWQREIEAFEAEGGEPRLFNPEWSHAICWMKPGTTCHSKKLEETSDGR